MSKKTLECTNCGKMTEWVDPTLKKSFVISTVKNNIISKNNLRSKICLSFIKFFYKNLF